MAERTIAQCWLCNHQQDVTGVDGTIHVCSKCGGNCSVYTSRKMTPEELAKYGPAAPIKRRTLPPVLSNDEQRRRVHIEEMNTMQALNGPNGKTNIDFLKARAEGATVMAIEKAWGMKLNTIYPWLGKWGLKGVSPKVALQLLGGNVDAKKDQPTQEGGPQGEDRVSSDQRVEDQAGESQDGQGTGPAAGEAMADGGATATHEEIRKDPLREEIDRLKEANVEVVALAGKTSEKQQAEIERLRHVLNEKIREADRLLEDKEELERLNAGLHKQLDAEKLDRDETAAAGALLQAAVERLEREVHDLREDRILLLSTIEKSAASAPVANDPVNHPAHYTFGAVECIDAIESATFGLQGGRAYSTGAAIKYLWRWSRKGGAEDLRKAEWYLRRLITDVDQEHREIAALEADRG